MSKPGCFSVVPLVIVFLAVLPARAQEVHIAVTPVGVAVVSESFPAEEFDFGPINGLTGTRVALLLKAGEGAIVGIEPSDSDIESFTDSTGRDLLQPVKKDRDGFGSSSGVDGFPPPVRRQPAGGGRSRRAPLPRARRHVGDAQG